MIFFKFMCMHACLCEFLSIMCKGPMEAGRKCQICLELELQAIVNCHVGPGNPTQVIPKSSNCSYNH